MQTKQKVYRVFDDGDLVLSTLDELKALRKYHSLMEAKEHVNTWGWIDASVLE